jgi:DNA-binding LytR/AlgR family response regulator
MTGIDFLKVKKDLPMVIITTAFPNYALEGFQFDAVDYLLKPITFNHFFKAAGKAHAQYSIKHSTPSTLAIKTDEVYFFVKCENKYEKIFIDKILFVQALQNYIIIQTETEKYMSLMPLRTIEENLNPSAFMRVHKSYLIATSKIKTLENHELILTDGRHIPISRNFRKDVHQKVLMNKLIRKESRQSEE